MTRLDPDPDEWADAVAAAVRRGGGSDAEARAAADRAYADRQTKPADNGWRLFRQDKTT